MKKRNKYIISIAAILVVIVAGVTVYGYSFFWKIKRKPLPKSNEELGITTPIPEEESKGIVNIAFFGLDRRNPNINTRSDSIMVVSIDSKTEKIKITSLMRDMYVPVEGHGKTKITHAYAYGGAALAVKTINSNFGLDIRDYVTVDFFGLQKLIDKVGGVQIDVKKNEVNYVNGGVREVSAIEKDNNPKYISGPGLQTLDGRQAVAYSRIRYVGHADYERTERQRRVLNQLFKKIKSQGAAKLPGTISSMLSYVETSLSNGEIMDLAMKTIKFNTTDLEENRLPIDGLFKSQKIDGMAVLVPDIEANKKKLHEFIYGIK